MSHRHLTTADLAPPPRARPRLGIRLHDSLLLRVALILTVAVVATIAALFVGIDHLVSEQFRTVHTERQERLATQAERLVAQERVALERLAELLANDAELANAAYYHLYLEGERSHPLAALERLSQAFNVPSLALFDRDGRAVAGIGGELPLLPIDPAAPGSKTIHLVWHEGHVWAVSTAPLLRNAALLAWLQLARPLDAVLEPAFGSDAAVGIVAARQNAPHNGVYVPLDVTGGSAWLSVALPDTVGQALAKVQTLLVLSLLVAGGLLLLALLAVLYRELRPLGTLAQAAAAVGRGEFGSRRLEVSGSHEVAQLVHAFNAMLGDLERMQEMERLSGIGRMAARVAHDINNPITVIDNMARLMLRELPAASPLAEDVQRILHHCGRCRTTVDLLLQYGRPIRLRRQRLELGALVRGCVEHWQVGRPEAPPPQVTTGGEVWVDADPYHLEQALANLFNNGQEAAPQGRLHVAVRPLSGYGEIEIRDAGPGFSDEAREHLFEPFYTSKRGGSGLGLASCRAVIHAHGGRVSVGEGPGGVIRVELPQTATAP
ncbi:sensor histidine kinase [Sulfurivermis fontis]|uniref:sensor histidine kinase n=1 Tax=Sulfurivermis fontis TaxID=1972068 RepID=UPI000FDA388D|nr:HAMP domain-containing sensor histidine kinase [Sulfurivermis fontis]